MYNVLVVEDEAIIRKSIIKEISWDSIGLCLAGEAENGEDALLILASKSIDIIITDMRMPICDGKQLLQTIEKQQYDCEIIVLSEFTDFAYMRQAIHAHVADYILKPIDPFQLNTLLKKICQQLSEKKYLAQNNKDALYNLYMCSVKHVANDLQKRACLIFDNTFPHTSIQIANIAICTKNQNASDITAYINEKMANAPFLSHAYIYKEDIHIYSILSILPYQLTVKINRQYVEWLKNLYEKCKNYFDCEIRIGTAHPVKNSQNLSIAFEHACIALDFLCHGNGSIVSYEKACKYMEAEFSFVIHYHQIQELLFQKEDIYKKIIQTYLDTIRNENYIYLPALRKSLIDFSLNIERCCLENKIAINLNILLGTNCIEQINQMDSYKTIEAFLHILLDKVYAQINSRHTLRTDEIINKIIQFVSSNYMDDLSLMAFSQQYFINYIYLSRQFKNTTGCTFTEFLQKIRMEKAYELIENYKYEKKVVAPLVGYNNPYYFINAYDKYFHFKEEKNDEK